MNKYSDYFEIDEGYWPEINPSSIKDPLNKWEKTYPHKTFIELLKATERMLSRETNNVKKGIWIEGAYGTGKSRVAWTLKNILDCREDDLRAYFRKYSALQVESDLLAKLVTHKQGKIITAYRYASSEIDSDRALIMAVYESITKALSDAGVVYRGENTLRGGVALWLSDDANKGYFNTLMALPEYRGLGSFAGKSADDVIRLLKDKNAKVEALMKDIFSLADSRQISALTISMDDLIAWLTDIIDQNQLKAIVLVWDEFSAYFKKNRTSLDEFQKLAELSNNKPFYLMIVTHMSGSIFSETDQTGKIVRDRFVRKAIEMPDSIAFELIRHALKVKDSQRDLWNGLADDINNRMSSSREAVQKVVWKNSTADEDVLKGILPLHPFAALLLKNISTAFASNQRSMFNFIKNAETENLQAFQWFIDNFSPDNGDILSIDYLWNFFYEKGTDEYGIGAGRINLDSMVRTILDTYPKNENRLNNEQKRILKTVLMMQAISEKLGDSVELFLPTEQNINYAFEGTDFEGDYAVNVIKNNLVKEGILYSKPIGNGKQQFAAAAVSGDQVQIDNIKKRIFNETKTAFLITNGGMEQVLSLTPALRIRYDVTPVTVENFTFSINRITNEPTTYKLRAILSFARNDEEQNRIRDLIKGAMNNNRYENLIFIDTSSTVLGGERFEQWVEFSANEEYWRTKDGKLADEISRKAGSILENWKTDIANGTFIFYSPFVKTGESYDNASSVLNALSNTVIRKYPLSFDNAKVSENFFLMSGLQSGAKFGMNQTCGSVFQANSVLPLMQGCWQIQDYWLENSSLPIARLKVEVDGLIKSAFERDERRIAIGEIFDALMEKGFMPCNLYAFLTGFLLKEYAVETYRYSDGETGDKMSVDKMAEIIAEYIKHKNTPIPHYREKFIALLSKEQIAFIEFAKVVFGISDNNSVERTAINIRSKMKDLGYPIWCFKEIDQNGLDDFIDKLASIANSTHTGESVAKIAVAIGRLLLQRPTAAANLAALFTKENAEKAMFEFLKGFEYGEILKVANEINAENVIQDVKRQVGSGEALWLWDQETGEEELRKLLTDYKIIAESNQLNPKTSSLKECFLEWKEQLKSIRIPYKVLIKQIPSLKEFFVFLRDIFTTIDLTYSNKMIFLNEIMIKKDEIVNLFSTKKDVFRKQYSYYLDDFSEEDVNLLYSKLPIESYIKENADFEKYVDEEAKKIREEKEKYKLHQLWTGLTSSSTPRDWSTRNRTPILSLVPISLHGEAKRAFGAINRSNPDETEVKFALDFLNKAAFLSEINDKRKIDEAFIRDIVDRFFVVLPDADEVRSRIESVTTINPFDWYGDPNVRLEVEKFAQARYNLRGCHEAFERIEKMDAEKAKEYLKRLIKDNMNVGIEILNDGGNIV